jgi:hypothetical protein
MRKNVSRFHKAVIVCLFALAAACAQPAAETGKVYDPGEVSATCAENLGLDGAVIMSLAAAFRDTNGKITDSFKEKAGKDIAESEGVPPSDSDAVFQQYISCLESSVAQ